MYANRLRASAWLPPSTRPTSAPIISHCMSTAMPSGFHTRSLRVPGQKPSGLSSTSTDGCAGPIPVVPSSSPPFTEMPKRGQVGRTHGLDQRQHLRAGQRLLLQDMVVDVLPRFVVPLVRQVRLGGHLILPGSAVLQPVIEVLVGFWH